jgi:hypothetical protein
MLWSARRSDLGPNFQEVMQESGKQGATYMEKVRNESGRIWRGVEVFGSYSSEGDGAMSA